ncbi:hypothetical protein CDL12_05530 [Handroanthus impetiginosus]|uniref:Uncharacterized protein n=1 Tax=Handroanthus impetiginosus TaxID=429701 RepID=A0A2G9HWQ9_9LAMI|nr:hypothetical protein CDL12_05530 [Handroanthus impetiginosus]
MIGGSRRRGATIFGITREIQGWYFNFLSFDKLFACPAPYVERKSQATPNCHRSQTSQLKDEDETLFSKIFSGICKYWIEYVWLCGKIKQH